jgi:hypothetical protein
MNNSFWFDFDPYHKNGLLKPYILGINKLPKYL